MKKSKFVEIVSSLTSKEYDAFKMYMEKIPSKKDAPFIKLYKYIINFYPDFTEADIERKKVYTKVFKGEAFNENKLFKVQTELTKHFEQFILSYNYSNDKLRQKFDLLNFYQMKNLEKFYHTSLRETTELVRNIPQSSLKYWYHSRIEEQKVIYDQKNNERKTDYQPIINAIFEFSETELLRWKNIAATNLFPLEYTYNAGSLLYTAHSHLNKLIREETDESFEILFQWSENHLHSFDKEYAREIMFGQINFCVKKINGGDLHYYRHALNVFNLFIRLGIITDPNGFITVATYKNYITTALKLGELDAAKHFLERYRSLLNPDFVDEVYAFNKANIAFEEKLYEDVSDLIININCNDIFYKLNTKRLLIKTYFELSKTDAAYFELHYNTLNAFKKYIYLLDTVPDVYLEANKNFVNLTARISNLRLNNHHQKAKLINEIKSTGKLAEREWLLEKCSY